MDLAKELIFAVRKNKSHGGYGLQRECEALVGHVLNNMVKTSLPTLVPEVKNDADSTKFREEGNQCFVTGDDDEAIEKYSISLAYANSNESRALALANRSAALYRKELYRECLIDVDAALGQGYPKEKRPKLKERAQKALGRLRTPQPKDQNMNELPSGSNDSSTGRRYTIAKNESEFAHGPSDEASGLSRGIEIAFSKRFGRHLVATDSFDPGDVLALEEPYAYVLYKEKFYTHCHNCLARSYNLISCPRCPIAMYCSESCRTTAWKTAHRIECPIYSVLANLLNLDKDKIRILTKIVRLLIVATHCGTAIDQVREDLKLAEKNPDDRTAGFTDAGIFESGSTRSALSLATNLAARPLVQVSAFACISALAAALLATETDFFGRKYRRSRSKDIAESSDIRFCGSLLFRSCVIVSSNSFSVQQEPGVKAGSGLYVTGSLMNHSCAPNTFRHFDGLKMITRTLEPIRPGDQIFTCYGGGYQYMPRSDRRRKMMEDYFFDCDCQACLEDWPTYSEILRNHIGSIAKTEKELVEQLKPFRERLHINKYDIDAVKSVLKILCSRVKMPCEEIVHAVQYLKSYYLDP